MKKVFFMLSMLASVILFAADEGKKDEMDICENPKTVLESMKKKSIKDLDYHLALYDLGQQLIISSNQIKEGKSRDILQKEGLLDSNNYVKKEVQSCITYIEIMNFLQPTGGDCL